MDDIGSTNQHYKNISTLAVAVLLLCVVAYLRIVAAGVDLLEFTFIEDEMWRSAAQIVVEAVMSVGLYAIIYFVVRAIYCALWIRNNKASWVRGEWLHIHVKRDLRVGTVEIRQNFNTVKAKGHNIRPKGDAAQDLKKETTWHYLQCKVEDVDEGHDFVGCYTADNVAQRHSKDGLHVLQIVGCDKRTGYANKMVGRFRDTIPDANTEIGDLADHTGELYFFRMSNKCRAYLYDENGFRYDRLFDLHELEEFANEPYVIKLKELLSQQSVTV